MNEIVGYGFAYFRGVSLASARNELAGAGPHGTGNKYFHFFSYFGQNRFWLREHSFNTSGKELT